MKPFLGQIAEAFYREYNRDIQNMVFVFPNRRAGIFFKKYLSDIIDGPIFSPTVTTVSDLFIQLSELQPADHIYLLFSLYRHYSDLCPQKESFDEFVPLGETLLNDFDDVDKCPTTFYQHSRSKRNRFPIRQSTHRRTNFVYTSFLEKLHAHRRKR